MLIVPQPLNEVHFGDVGRYDLAERIAQFLRHAATDLRGGFVRCFGYGDGHGLDE